MNGASMHGRQADAGGRSDRVAGQPLSPRAFRAFGVEAVVLGRATEHAGLQRREGVAVWRRLPEHAELFDRLAAAAPRVGDGEDDLRAVPVVVATAPRRARALRVPAIGARAEWAWSASERVPPGRASSGWLLLVDEGPGETWLYRGEGGTPAKALDDFLGRRGRTDFGRARQRVRQGGLGSLGAFAGLVLLVYASAFGLGMAGQLAGVAILVVSLVALVGARPR
jgi:hypothetical protein